jgi:hypothetical protein
MYRKRKLGFQTAAHKRAAGDPIRSACSLVPKHLPQGSAFFVSRTGPTPSDRRDGAASASNTSRAANHGFLMVTSRFEFPATVTKQSPGYVSTRYKIAAFSSEFPAPPRNRQEPSSPEFLIANLELEFFLNIAKSTKYNFLIANKRDFSVRLRRLASSCPRISFRVPESKLRESVSRSRWKAEIETRRLSNYSS